jgi:hypothetical protein
MARGFDALERAQHFELRFNGRRLDEARRELAPITQAAIIAWLLRRGSFAMPIVERKKSVRGWVREHASALLAIGFVVGLGLGWLLAGGYKVF